MWYIFPFHNLFSASPITRQLPLPGGCPGGGICSLLQAKGDRLEGEPLRKLDICPLELEAWVHEHSHESSHEAEGPAVGWWSNVTPNFEHLNRGTFKRHASGWDALSSGRRRSSQQASLLQTQKKHPPPQEKE